MKEKDEILKDLNEDDYHLKDDQDDLLSPVEDQDLANVN